MNGDSRKTNGLKIDNEEIDEVEINEDEPRTPLDSDKQLDDAEASIRSEMDRTPISNTNGVSTTPITPTNPLPDDVIENLTSEITTENGSVTTAELGQSISPEKSPQTSALGLSDIDTEARFDALVGERTSLRDEVAQLRRFLEEIQEKHEEDLANFREQLEESRGEKEQAETQYRNLLGKVNTIRSQLGERLKADAVSSVFSLIIRGSFLHRKTCHKQEVELRTLKSSAKPYVRRMILVSLNWRPWQNRVISTRRNSQVFEIEPHCRSKIG